MRSPAQESVSKYRHSGLSATSASVLCLGECLRRELANGRRGRVRRLIGTKVVAEIINQRIAILRINFRTPLRHFVHFLRPGCLAPALLHDDPSLVTTQTCR